LTFQIKNDVKTAKKFKPNIKTYQVFPNCIVNRFKESGYKIKSQKNNHLCRLKLKAKIINGQKNRTNNPPPFTDTQEISIEL
jgi:hypothetical protein